MTHVFQHVFFARLPQWPSVGCCRAHQSAICQSASKKRSCLKWAWLFSVSCDTGHAFFCVERNVDMIHWINNKLEVFVRY